MWMTTSASRWALKATAASLEFVRSHSDFEKNAYGIPRRSSSSRRCGPTKPDPPVMRTFLGTVSSDGEPGAFALDHRLEARGDLVQVRIERALQDLGGRHRALGERDPLRRF